MGRKKRAGNNFGLPHRDHPYSEVYDADGNLDIVSIPFCDELIQVSRHSKATMPELSKEDETLEDLLERAVLLRISKSMIDRR